MRCLLHHVAHMQTIKLKNISCRRRRIHFAFALFMSIDLQFVMPFLLWIGSILFFYRNGLEEI